MPRLDLDAIPQTNATSYPAEHAPAVSGRWYRRLAPAGGLTHFGASHVVLKPGAWSSHRHWHDGEDEMVVMLSGEAVLVEGGPHEEPTRTVLRPGDICVWPAGTGIGHNLCNESDTDCSFVAISGGVRSSGGYCDIDMLFTADNRYTYKDGRDYGAERV